MKIKMCPKCLDYKRKGHNYCRMCGYHLTKGHVQNIRQATIYNVKEKYCGYCGGPKYRCSCWKRRKTNNI